MTTEIYEVLQDTKRIRENNHKLSSEMLDHLDLKSEHIIEVWGHKSQYYKRLMDHHLYPLCSNYPELPGLSPDEALTFYDLLKGLNPLLEQLYNQNKQILSLLEIYFTKKGEKLRPLELRPFESIDIENMNIERIIPSPYQEIIDDMRLSIADSIDFHAAVIQRLTQETGDLNVTPRHTAILIEDRFGCVNQASYEILYMKELLERRLIK